MSHFTVLVPANDEQDLEDKLIPFWERDGDEHDDDPRYKPHLEFRAEHKASEFEEKARAIFDSLNGDEKYYQEYKDLLEAKCYTAIFENWDGGSLNPETGDWGYWRGKDEKWDWYQIGGRWTGMLQLKPQQRLSLQVEQELARIGDKTVKVLIDLFNINQDAFEKAVLAFDSPGRVRAYVEKVVYSHESDLVQRPFGSRNGEPGLMTEPNTDDLRADTAYVKDIDWDAMLQEQIDNRMERYQVYQEYLSAVRDGELDAEALEKAQKIWDEDGRGEYCQAAFGSIIEYAQSIMVRHLAWEDRKYFDGTFQEMADLFYKSEQEYRDMFKSQALTFAFIDLQGKWNQRGQMGWFACVSDENANYDVEFWNFIKSLPKEQRVYVVDCHI